MDIRQALIVGLLALSASLPVAAHPVVFGGTLSNLGEPAPANLSLGTGLVSVIFDDDAFTMTVNASFSGLTGNTTAAHIHCCTSVAGAGNAGVATQIPSFSGFPLGVTSGSFSQTFDLTQASSWNPAFVTANGGTLGSAFAAFATGLFNGKVYFNVHTTFVGGGEIRAFLAPAPVPVPASVALMASGLLSLLAVLRQRRAAA